jgi:hypothetical protein
MNDEETAFFEKTIDAGELSVPFDEAPDLPLSLLRQSYLVDMYIDRNGFIFVVSDETAAFYTRLRTKRFISMRNYFCSMDKFASAAANLYGVTDYCDFLNIYNKWNRKKTNLDEIGWVLSHFVALGRSNYVLRNKYIVHKYLDGDSEKIEEIIAKHANISIREQPSKKDFLQYTDDKYYELTHSHELLIEFLKNNLPEAAEDPTLPNALVNISNRLLKQRDSVGKVYDFLENGLNFDLEKNNAMQALIADMRNNSRIHGNNGWTPNELAENFRKDTP